MSDQSTPISGPGMLIDHRFGAVAGQFFRTFRRRPQGGGALTIHLNGQPVLDIWTGWADTGRPWEYDTMALSYSSGKGVAATVANRLIERGALALDEPVSTYWPEFAAHGKQDITVSDVLRHRAGLQRIRGLSGNPQDMLDHDYLAAALAAQAPDPWRARASGYHGLTFGTLVAEIAQRATGAKFDELLQSELRDPVGDNDFWFGVPPSQRHRIARLTQRLNIARIPFDRLLAPIGALPSSLLRSATSAAYDGWADLSRGERAYDTMMPSWNGVFTARSLSRMYSAIANDGLTEGRRLFRPETTRALAEMPPNSTFDYVLGVPPHFARGYHRAPVGTKISRHALGHYGIGGSGGLALPHLGLSLGFVTNHLGNHANSIGDARLPHFAHLAVRALRATQYPAPWGSTALVSSGDRT
ncbi:serine hydrolase domain-containing protein [Nocardia sp. NPDC006630]|uniref:serine hydrolase domain-containing protein n=1 Tax=Nocardia sp. NPDC006630 TaxID=3157181 RepID=UPI0033B5115B